MHIEHEVDDKFIMESIFESSNGRHMTNVNNFPKGQTYRNRFC